MTKNLIWASQDYSTLNWQLVVQPNFSFGCYDSPAPRPGYIGEAPLAIWVNSKSAHSDPLGPAAARKKNETLIKRFISLPLYSTF